MVTLCFTAFITGVTATNNMTAFFEDDDAGVPVRKFVKDLKRKRQAERQMMEDELSIYSDRGDMEYLADYYRNPKSHLRKSSTSTRTEREAESINATQTGTTRAGVYDVIIIGAGWAGLSAAMTLQSKGITNFKIIEAKDYIGGRSHTTYESFNGANIAIDEGSMWLHGGVDNPLYDIVTAVGGIPTSESSFAERLYKSNGGGAYTSQQLNSFYNELYENGFMPYQASKQESTNNDQPLQNIANQYLNTVSSAEKKAVAKYMMTSYIELEYSAPMSEVSERVFSVGEYRHLIILLSVHLTYL